MILYIIPSTLVNIIFISLYQESTLRKLHDEVHFRQGSLAFKSFPILEERAYKDYLSSLLPT